MILVAGGTGFIGGAVVRELARRGDKVAVLSHSADKARAAFPGLDVEVRAGDARDASTLPAAVKGVDAIVSAMQFPNFPVEDKKKGYTFDEVDAAGNERLVAAAKDAGVKTYVYLSGAGAAKDGEYPWLRAKWRAEEAIRTSGLRYTLIRPSWVYGPGDKSLNRFAAFARTLPFVPVIGNGKQRVRPVFLDDVMRLAVESLTAPAAANQTFEIGGPDEMSMDELLRVMLDVMGKKKPMLHAPAAIPRLAGAAMALLPLPNRSLSPDAVTFITMDALANNAALQKAFPEMRLTPLREGLTSYLSPGASAANKEAAPAR